MPIPFPPDGPQVQAALQKVPTSQLQNYAAGRPPQPTGQVTPGPMGAAAEALNARGAMGAANQRQQAMNNKVSDSTIFQQKDMQIQQAMQALQQKEQQLGVKAALIDQMAQQARNAQMRDTMGVSTLPLPQDAFTAMDGGIVFSGGGGVEGYARRGLVQDLGTLEDRMAEGFTERGIDRMVDEEEEDPLQRRIRNIEKAAERRRLSAESAMYTPEQKEALENKERERLGEQYSKYKQGIAGLDEEAAAAIRGRPANTMQGIAAGLAALPADLRGIRLAGLMTRLAGGVASERAKAEDREREASKYLIDARRKAAAADLAEERNQDTLARALRESEQRDRLRADELLGRAATTEIESQRSIAEAESRERSEARRTKEAAERLALDREKQAFDVRKHTEEPQRQEYLLRLQAKLARENRPPSDQEKLIMRATLGMSDKEITEFSKDLLLNRGRGAGADGRPTYDQITDNVEQRMRNTDINKIIKAAAKDPKNPRTLTEADIREMFFDEEIARAKRFYGEDVFKGMKPSKSSSAGAVDTSNPLLSGKP